MLHPADDGQQARNSCIYRVVHFFSGVTHSFCSCTYNVHVNIRMVTHACASPLGSIAEGTCCSHDF